MGRWAPADCPLRHLPSPSPSRRLRADQRRQRCVINGDAGSRGQSRGGRRRADPATKGSGAALGAAGCVLASGADLRVGHSGHRVGGGCRSGGTRLQRVHGALQYPGHLCVVQKRKGWGYVYGRRAQMCYQGKRGPTCAVIMGLRDSS